MTKTLEKMARAIDSGLDAPAWTPQDLARAALMAIRDGSDDIDRAVARAAWHSGSGQHPGNVWCAGVDAILAEADGGA